MSAVTLLGTATFDTNSGTKTVTATPAVGDLIVLVTAHTGNTSAAAPTDNNADGAGSYSEITAAASVKATSADQMRFWVRNQKIAVAASTVFTHAPGASTGGGVMVFKVTGMTRWGTNAVRQSAVQNNQSAAGTPTPVLGATSLTGNSLIGAVFNATNPSTMTARASWTETNDTGFATPTTGIETMTRDSGETSTSIAWGGTSASAFCASVIELDSSTASMTFDGAADGGELPPVRIDNVAYIQQFASNEISLTGTVEEPESWWSGVQFAFTRVATALTLATAAFSAATAQGLQQQPEEFVPQAATPLNVDVDGWMPTSLVVPPVARLWYGEDEKVTAAAALPFDEEPPEAVIFVDTAAQFWFSGEDNSLPSIQVDEEPWINVAPPVPPTLRLWYGEDEKVTAQTSVVLDSDHWGYAVQAVPATVQLWQGEDEIARIGVDEDGWMPAAPPAPAVRVLQADDDAFAVPATLVVEVEGWIPGPVIVPPTLQLWGGEDERETVPANLGVDEEPWTYPAQVVPPVARLWQGEDEVVTAPPALGVDVDAWDYPVQRVPATVQLWQGEDEVARIGVDEEGWLPGAAPVAAVVRLWQGEDEIFPLLTLAVEVEGWLPATAIVAPTLRLWGGEDERETPPAPLGVDVDPWFYTAPLLQPVCRIWYDEWHGSIEVPPVYGWGARGGVGSKVASDPWQRIGTEVATDAVTGIGTTTATAITGKIGTDTA